MYSQDTNHYMLTNTIYFNGGHAARNVQEALTEVWLKISKLKALIVLKLVLNSGVLYSI